MDVFFLLCKKLTFGFQTDMRTWYTKLSAVQTATPVKYLSYYRSHEDMIFFFQKTYIRKRYHPFLSHPR